MNGGKGSDFGFENGKIIRRKSENETVRSTLSQETESRRILENFRESRARKTALKRTAAVIIILFVVLVLVAVAVFVFFRINDVSVSGSQVYTEQELRSALKLSGTSNLFLTSSSTLEGRLRSAYPSLDEIKIKKQLPDKLIITVSDGVPAYYLRMGGDVYVLTDTLKVMSSGSEVPDGCKELLSCDIQTAVLGEIMTFKTATHYNYLISLLNDISSHPSASHIVKIDMSKKFDVKLKYDDRFVINIGKAENTLTKLTLAESVIASLPDTDRGIIDASDIEKCSYRKTDEIN